MSPFSHNELIEALHVALTDSRSPNACLRRSMLIARNPQEPADAVNRYLAYCRAVVLENGDPKAPPTVLDYGSWAFEEIDLEPRSAEQWVQGLITRTPWRWNEWVIGTPSPLNFTHEYKSGGRKPLLEYPHHWLRTGFPRFAGSYDGPLLRAGLPAYPDWKRLAHDRLGLDHDDPHWMGEFHLLIPTFSARLLDVGFRSKRVVATVLVREPTKTGLFLRLWALADGRHVHRESPASGGEVKFDLPHRPQRLALYLMDGASGAMIDSWGDGWRDLPIPEALDPAAKWRARILDGEGQDLEFKHYCNPKEGPDVTVAKLIDVQDLGREMVAFANTNDGVILLGVKDDTTICGVLDPRSVRAKIADAAHDCCRPPLTPPLSTIHIDGKKLLAVTVKRTGKIHQTNKRQVLVRRNGTVRQAEPSEYEAILQPTTAGLAWAPRRRGLPT